MSISNTSPQFQDTVIDNGYIECHNCGHIGIPKQEKLLRKKDIIIFLLTSLLGGIGILYLIVTILLRLDLDKRKHFCESCGTELSVSINTKNETKINPNISKTFNVAKTVLKDKDIQRSLKEIKKAFKDVHNTFDPF